MAWRHPPYFREQGGAGRKQGRQSCLAGFERAKARKPAAVLAASGETFETIEEQRAAKPAAAA